ncbi:MAG TPA: transglycosylase domain-containing protein [Chryseosolibacter sp.]
MPDRQGGWTFRITHFFSRPNFWKRFFRLALRCAAGVLALTAGFVFLVWAGFFGKLPSREDLRDIQNPVASEVYSADSVLLGRYYQQDRSPVDASEIPKSLKNALIATEDIRFFEHDGIDYRSLFRVLIKSLLLQDEGSGGGSTITQQLAKNLYPRKSYMMLSLPINKVREFLIAKRIENVYSKDEILVLYLNTIPFADNTYGVKTAADRFFSKKVKDLTIDEAAMLIGMLKATHYYNPRLFPERAVKRRNVVISQMSKYDFIKVDDKKRFQAKPLALKYNPTSYTAGLAPYFRAHIQRELLQWCKENEKEDGSPYNLYTDGLKIYTTIDSRMQKYAEEAVRSHMKSLQAKFQNQLNKKKIEALANTKIKQLPQYKRMIADGMSHEKAIARLKRKLKTKVFTWEGEKAVEMSTYDSLKHHLQFLQTGVLAMEPQTGDIKVWVGGIDNKYFKYDHVRENTKRQVGSTLKPLLYAAALEKGVNPCSYISARQESYTNLDGWTPANTQEDTYEQKYSMEGGLAGSVNTVSVKLLEKTGINNAISVVRRMGINSELPAVPSLALGTPTISVIEMVNAYSVLANQGMHNEPSYLLSITDRKGNLLQKFKKEAKPERALSKESTQLMIQMLQSVVSEGTGASLRTRYGITNDVAGKTGTTQANVDGWFIAIMPKLVIGTWVGADDPSLHFRSTALGQGSATALPIVAKFIEKANKDKTLRPVMRARFPELPSHLASQLDCKRSKSNKNLFERIFAPKKKKGIKVTKYKGRRDRNG